VISAKLDAARSLMPLSLEIPADIRASRIAALSSDDSTLSLAPSESCAFREASAGLGGLAKRLPQPALERRQFDRLGDQDRPGHQRGEQQPDDPRP